MANTVTIAGYKPRDVPVALRWAENEVRSGALLDALDKFRRAATTLQEHTRPDDWGGEDVRQDYLRQAQYGEAVTLFHLMRVGEAQATARDTLNGSFKGIAFGRDQRRYILSMLANAVTPTDLGGVWTLLLKRSRSQHVAV